MLYFSPSSCGFYDDKFHVVLPPDVVTISTERHAELMNEQARGLIIAAGPNGLPVAAPPTITHEQRLAEVRRQRNQLLAASDHTQMADVPLSEEQRAAWREYRQALRDLPVSVTDLSAIAWPIVPSN